MSMKTHLRHILSIGLLFAFLVGSSGAWAVNCLIKLTTQAQVDAFPQDCGSVLSYIQVGFYGSSSGITNLDGLLNLTISTVSEA